MDGGVALPRFRNCTGRAFTPAPIQPWRHDYLTPIVTAAGAANHWGRDLMVPTTPGTVVRGKFTYGLVSVDLEDEDVRVSIDDCTSWVALGDHTTDANGEIAVPLSAGLEPGVYEVRFERHGPSRASSWSTATKIAEVADAGTPRERPKRPDEDRGLLWRWNAYWRYEQVDQGVVVECESVTLSRTIPLLLRPVAGPIVGHVARESMDRTLSVFRERFVKTQ